MLQRTEAVIPEVVGKNSAIQALRGFAAIGVVFAHAYGRSALPFEFPRHAPQIGVDIFFCLSGYLMLSLHCQGFGELAGSREFVWRRVTRIVPLYWLLTLTAVALAASAPFLFSNTAVFTTSWVIGSLFFLPVASPDGFVVPVIGVGWTLNYEMVFYLLFAIGMLLPLRRGVALIAVSVIALTPFYPMAVQFLFGMAIAWTWQARPQWIQRSAYVLWILALCAVPATIYVGPTDSLVRGLAWGVPAAASVALIVRSNCTFGAIPRLLGDASYSIYLIQVFTIPASFKLMSMVGIGGLSAIGLSIAGTIFAGLVLWRLIEMPVSKGLLRHFQVKRLAVTNPA